MRITLFEPNPGGHRYAYVRRLAPALAAIGETTLVTSREGVAAPEFEAQVRPVLSHLKVESSMERGDPATGRAYHLHLATHLRRCATELGADHVLLPYADGTIQMAGLRRMMGRFSIPQAVEIEGLMMRGSFAYERGGGLRAMVRRHLRLMLTAAAPLAIVHHLDPIVVRVMSNESRSLAKRLRLLPDPVEEFTPMEQHAARSALGIATDGRLIGCVGVQDRRKGIDRLIHAFVHADLRATDRLLLMGRHTKEISETLAQVGGEAIRAGRIISMDRYISDDELATGIAAMNVVATPYPPNEGHSGSSSIVIHAAGQGRLCLGCEGGWVGETIRRFGLGDTCDVMDDTAFAGAVQKAMDRSEGFRSGESASRFAAFHRPDNFVACFTKRLRERAGLPAVQGLREWSWVLEAAEAR